MSKLNYTFTIEEALLDDESNVKQYIKTNLPHFAEISDWLPKEWEDYKIHTRFTGVLKDKIVSTKMTVKQNQYDNRTVAHIDVEFVPGFQVTLNHQEEFWEQMETLMTDGFGKMYELHQISGVDNHYRICV